MQLITLMILITLELVSDGHPNAARYPNDPHYPHEPHDPLMILITLMAGTA